LKVFDVMDRRKKEKEETFNLTLEEEHLSSRKFVFILATSPEKL